MKKKLFILLGALMFLATPTLASHVSVTVSNGGGHYYHRYYRPSYGCGHCRYHRPHYRPCRHHYCGYYGRPYYSHRYYRPRYYSSYTIDLGYAEPTLELKTDIA